MTGVYRWWDDSRYDDGPDDPDRDEGPPWYGEQPETVERIIQQKLDSGRRAKLFARAFVILTTAAKMRGHDEKPGAWYARSGRRRGLYVRLDPDHEMHWSPRAGYSVVECVDPPF